MFNPFWKSIVGPLILAGIFCGSASAVPLQVPPVIETPGVYGDQLLFFFDARKDRVPFITISNLAPADIDLEVVFYPQDLGRTLAVESRTLVGYGNVVLDPTRLAGVAGHAGLAVVTPVGGSPLRAVVPPSAGAEHPAPPLFGSFTLANTELGAGFGQNPLARVAVDVRGERPKPGTPVDGRGVLYQQIAPEALIVPSYFRPDTLSPASKDGNRIILVSFFDDYQSQLFRVRAQSVAFDAEFADADGKLVASKKNIEVKGVHLDTLQNLAGSTALQKSGKISFEARQAIPGLTNVFGLVAQSLGTFSIGQRMPGIFLTDHEAEKIVFVAKPVAGASLGGLKGADSLCQQDATAAGLKGRYLAWMSDSRSSPSTRFKKFEWASYVLPFGEPVAFHWDDLVKGDIRTEIDVTADGGTFNYGPYEFVYSNTWADGTAVETDPSKICDDWTSAKPGATVSGGSTKATDAAWSSGHALDCGPSSADYGIYCVEQ